MSPSSRATVATTATVGILLALLVVIAEGASFAVALALPAPGQQAVSTRTVDARPAFTSTH